MSNLERHVPIPKTARDNCAREQVMRRTGKDVPQAWFWGLGFRVWGLGFRV